MGCVNHPNAPAVASCQRCSVQLCGTCTKFLDSGEYCEKCGAAAESDDYLKFRDRNQEERSQEMIKATSARMTEEEAREKARRSDGLYIKGGIVMACLMLSVSLGLYAFPNLMKSEQQVAEEQGIIRLEECRQVFQAIGIRLSEGEVPDSTMNCPGTNIPNIVLRQGDKVTVSHPNPAQFGLTQLYVTSDSHRVVMVGQEQG